VIRRSCLKAMTAPLNPRPLAPRPLAAAVACALLLLVTSPARAGTANAGLAGALRPNPLAGMRWGVYTGSADNSPYPYYAHATGRNRQLLAKIALRPLMFSFGAWYADDQAKLAAQQFIAATTGGDPGVLSQVAVFRMDPWEGQACPGSWSAANQASYRSWVDQFAAGIGASRVALVLQPDLPFASCSRSRVPYELVSYAARAFSALPHTTVYIDAGARYWPMPFSAAPRMLELAGIRYARGFALNSTEYDSTGAEVEYGARIARALAAAGYPGKHFVVNTAENGAPFLNGQYPGGNPANPRVCSGPHDRLCATLGIPPTTQVANRHWGLSGYDRALAARYADAYVWVGRPWLDYGSDPFDLSRALGLAASTPF
jgi:endoglucanase